jgi:hypothetical protein
MNPPLRDARPEQIATEGNLPPQLRKGGGKEIRDSWRQTKVGSRYGTCEVLGELFRRKKPPAARKFYDGSSEIAELSWMRWRERERGGE